MLVRQPMWIVVFQIGQPMNDNACLAEKWLFLKNPCTVKSSRAFTQPTYMHMHVLLVLIHMRCTVKLVFVVDQPRCLLPLKKIIGRINKILAPSPDTCNILSINIFWAS
ncbi:hypothetical protein VPH35_059227 [Triticum aestivum]